VAVPTESSSDLEKEQAKMQRRYIIPGCQIFRVWRAEMNKPILWAVTFAACAVTTILNRATAQNPSIITPPPVTFSSVGIVSAVQMTGTAAWHYGSDEQSGTVSLKAVANGQNTMELQLDRGKRVEAQSPLTDSVRTCTWSGFDGVEHVGADHNCWLGTVWFLPQITLQPGAGATDAVISAGTGESGKSQIHHERHPSGVRDKGTAKLLTEISANDLEIDATSGFPQVLTFNAHSDADARLNIPTEIHFSDYRNVQGVEIPFRIQKFVNHSLVLDLQISEAKVQLGQPTVTSPAK